MYEIQGLEGSNEKNTLIVKCMDVNGQVVLFEVFPPKSEGGKPPRFIEPRIIKGRSMLSDGEGTGGTLDKK